MCPRNLKSLNKQESEIREQLNEAEAEKSFLSKCNSLLKSMREDGLFTDKFISSYVRLSFLTFLAFDRFISTVYLSLVFKGNLGLWCVFLNKKLWEQFEVSFHIEGTSIYFAPFKTDETLRALISEQSLKGTLLEEVYPFMDYFNEFYSDEHSFNLNEFKEEYDVVLSFFFREKASEKNYEIMIEKFKNLDALAEMPRRSEKKFQENLEDLVKGIPLEIKKYENTIRKLEESLEKVLHEKEQIKKTKKEKRI